VTEGAVDSNLVYKNLIGILICKCFKALINSLEIYGPLRSKQSDVLRLSSYQISNSHFESIGAIFLIEKKPLFNSKPVKEFQDYEIWPLEGEILVNSEFIIIEVVLIKSTKPSQCAGNTYLVLKFIGNGRAE